MSLALLVLGGCLGGPGGGDAAPMLEPGTWGTYVRAPEPALTYSFLGAGDQGSGDFLFFAREDGESSTILLFSSERGELVGTLSQEGALTRFEANASGPLGEWAGLPLARWQFEAVGHVDIGGRQVDRAEMVDGYSAKTAWTRHHYADGAQQQLPVQYELRLGDAAFPRVMEGADTLTLQDTGTRAPGALPILPRWFTAVESARSQDIAAAWMHRDLPPIANDQAAHRFYQAHSTLMNDQTFADTWNHPDRRFCGAQLTFFRPAANLRGWNWQIEACVPDKTVAGTVRWDPILQLYTVAGVDEQPARTLPHPDSLPSRLHDLGDVLASVLPQLSEGGADYMISIGLTQISASTLVFAGDPVHRTDAVTYEFVPAAGSQPHIAVHAATGAIGWAQWMALDSSGP